MDQPGDDVAAALVYRKSRFAVFRYGTDLDDIAVASLTVADGLPPPGVGVDEPVMRAARDARRGARAQACRSVLKRGFEVAEHAELGEDDRALGVAVEPLDLAVVGQLEDVAARCVHHLAGRRQDPGGQVQRT